MTYTVRVHLRYRARLPLLADVLHIITPNMFPDYYDLSRPAQEIYFLSK